VLKEGMTPSFCVSAQWKIFWYSFGSDKESVEGMVIDLAEKYDMTKVGNK
jgi:hypothetical protein